LNSGSTVTTTTTTSCPAGYTCVANGSTTTTTSGVISTPGVEGTLTVTTSNTGLPSSVYEGDVQVGILGFKAEAKSSDILVQRIKVDLGASSKIYNKAFKKLYVKDGSTIVASMDLNSSTVVKESDGRYTATLSGFSILIPKDGSKNLVIAADVMGSIDSTDISTLTGTAIRLYGTSPGTAVRGIDGAGIDQFSGSNSVTRNLSLSGSLTDAATLKLSTNSATPKSAQVIASAGADKDEADKVTTLIFDVKAEKDNVTLTDLIATTTGTAVTGSRITTAYLFEGTTEIDNASVNSGVATFNDIDLVINKDTKRTFTIKVDVRDAQATIETASTTITAAGLSAENAAGDTVTAGTYLTGSASGETMSIKKSGATITLLSKSTGKTTTTNTNAATSTTVLDGIFTVRVTADGADVVLGSTASSSPFAKTSAVAADDSFTVYKNGADQATTTFSAVEVVSYAIPETGVTINSSANTFTIADGNYADIEVHAKITVTGAAAANDYAIQLKKLFTNGTTVVNFMDGQSTWRTSPVVLP
jgi:hypothetical protein